MSGNRPWRHFFVSFLFAILAAGCSKRADTGAIRASGTLQMTEVYLSPSVAGRVEALAVHEGDAVKAGQRVATLDRFEKAQRDYERSRRLESGGGSTIQQTENAALAVKDQQLVSPIDGFVLMRVSEPGEVVTPGTPVVIIGDPNDVWVRLYIPEQDIGRVTLGQAASIEIDSFSGRRFEGRVSFISPKAEFTPKNVQTREERATQMFAIKVAVVKPEGLLKPGMPADCELQPAR